MTTKIWGSQSFCSNLHFFPKFWLCFDWFCMVKNSKIIIFFYLSTWRFHEPVGYHARLRCMTSAHWHFEEKKKKHKILKGMFTIKGKAILLSLATTLLIHTVKTTFHELMETTHGLAIAFGNKGQVGLSGDALWWNWVGLIYGKHAVSFKSTSALCTDTTLEPQWQFGDNHFSLVAYHRITAVSKLLLRRRVQEATLRISVCNICIAKDWVRLQMSITLKTVRSAFLNKVR